jgi:hypothetical protein
VALWDCVSAVEQVYGNLPHPVHLESSAGRPDREQSKVAFTDVKSRSHPIETSLYCRKIKFTDHTLSNTGIHELGEGLIFRGHFGPIRKTKAAKLQLPFQWNAYARYVCFTKPLKLFRWFPLAAK